MKNDVKYCVYPSGAKRSIGYIENSKYYGHLFGGVYEGEIINSEPHSYITSPNRLSPIAKLAGMKLIRISDN